jgi:hypothetical protein
MGKEKDNKRLCLSLPVEIRVGEEKLQCSVPFKMLKDLIENFQLLKSFQIK